MINQKLFIFQCCCVIKNTPFKTKINIGVFSSETLSKEKCHKSNLFPSIVMLGDFVNSKNNVYTPLLYTKYLLMLFGQSCKHYFESPFKTSC